jgi:NADPH:quinone reductase-like Zn-dependent oxidoreductase
MQAAVVNTLGEGPTYQSFPVPEPMEGEVLVRVLAASLHPVVKALASGSHYAAGGNYPMVPGVDGVGTLEDGSRVFFTFARKPWGSMCERTVCPRAWCLPVPDSLDSLTAAALPNPGMSAWLSLKDRARMVPGERVLILGATGVAGRLALQAARQLGAGRVIAAGRNTDAITPGSADAVISLNQPDDKIHEAFREEAAQGIDVVIDYLWGKPTELLLAALAKGFRTGGTHPIRLVEVGESAGKSINLPGAILRSVNVQLMGSGFGSAPLEQIFGAIPNLFAMAAAGSFSIDVVGVPLAEVAAAWNRVEKGRRIVFQM